MDKNAPKILGIDIGSSTTKAVLLDGSLGIVSFGEWKNSGNPAEALRSAVSHFAGSSDDARLRIGITGSGRDIVGTPREVFLTNEVIALAVGAGHYYPGARSVIEIGAQTSRWVLLESGEGGLSDPGILDFALNDVCAAGSGAFLEQQASRLRLEIGEFAGLAASAGKGAVVAGRCSVFAKTDMIHLQQKGTPLEEIAFGLCLALARNFTATVLKGREALPPVLISGGGARNFGLVRAFREILPARDGRLSVADPPHLLCALGAALGASKAGSEIRAAEAGIILRSPETGRSTRKTVIPPLGKLEIRRPEEPAPQQAGCVHGYLGVDIGSVSTNLVLVGEDGNVAAGIYLPTKGRPIEVLREGYRLLLQKCPGGMNILGVGTTGSGRHLAGTLLQADVVHNEITCQLRSAARYFPEVDTIFEIGGQDSKYISVRDGKIADFAMNKICAAGTGSFLEEQADLLGIRIEDEFSGKAERSRTPADLGSRCTVFMESELSDALGRGVSVSDISAGLAFSIARNYLEKVVAGRPVGRAVVFQGGVASNPSVVRAFALELGREMRVHPHNRISGAIGAALVAAEAVAKSGKRSLDAAAIGTRLEREYRVTSFTCAHCSNSCQVNRIEIGEEAVCFGDACERHASRQGLRPALRKEEDGTGPGPPPNLFKEREELARTYVDNPSRPVMTIGLTRASIFSEYLPFWAVFFNSLGASLLVSPASNPEILELGLRKLPAEMCLPIKIAFGHVEWFRDKPVDRIFFPSVVDGRRNPPDPVSFCAYSENFPFMAKAATEAGILSPSVDMGAAADGIQKSLAEVRGALGKSEDDIKSALEAARSAQEDFQEKLRKRGSEILRGGRDGPNPVWAVLGRPYTLHDSFLNLNLARHLEKLSVQALPIDFLPLDGSGGAAWPGAPHWRYNQQAVRAALWCADHPDIRPVILTNFGCGLDAFNLRHVLKIVAGRPHLVLEFDEHRAEAGLITRLEAFRDETEEARRGREVAARRAKPQLKPPESFESYRARKFVLPYFADHAFAFSGALKGVGIEAEMLPLPDRETVALGEQHSTGKECHAYSIIAGDFVKFAGSLRRGGEVFFFPGTKYTCVLAQYDKGMNFLAEDLGVSDLEALSPAAEALSQILGMKGLKLLWQGLVSIDLLIRAACAIRPYEMRKGAADEAHLRNLEDIETSLTTGDIGPALKRCAERLRAVGTRTEKRPVIGIAGDVYTRLNPVANHGLFLKLEELGCEVRPSSFFVEDVDFDLGRSLRRKIGSRKYKESTVMALLYLRKELEKLKIRMKLEPAARIHRDSTFNEIVRFSSPYIGLENNHIVLLNIAKMVEFARMGADGVINAICFNCMLGTVSAAIAGKIRRDYDNIPIPTFIFTGSELASEKTKLEAFVFQVKQGAGRKKKGSHLYFVGF